VQTPRSGATCENNHGEGVDEKGERVFSDQLDPGSGVLTPDEGEFPQVFAPDEGFAVKYVPPDESRPPPWVAYGFPPPVRPSSEVMIDLLALVRKHWPNETSVVQKAMAADMYWVALKKGEA
jgi:hypothetical protein